MSTLFAEAFDLLQEARDQADALSDVEPEPPLSEEETRSAVDAIRAHCRRWDVPPAALADALDVRADVVETLLAEPGSIPAPRCATLLRRANAWCEQDQAMRVQRQGRYVRTAVTRIVLAVARTVRATRTVGLLAGGPGVGKTAALEAVCAELPGRTIVLRADPSQRSAKGALRLVGEAAGNADRVGQPSVKLGLQVARGSNGLIVIDEAQLLTAAALEAVRAVFDQADVGVLLVGTKAVADACGPDGDPLCGPLASRVAVRRDLDAELAGQGAGGWIDLMTVQAIVSRHTSAALERPALLLLTMLAQQDAGHLRTAINAARVASILAGRDGAPGRVSRRHVMRAVQLAGVHLP